MQNDSILNFRNLFSSKDTLLVSIYICIAIFGTFISYLFTNYYEYFTTVFQTLTDIIIFLVIYSNVKNKLIRKEYKILGWGFFFASIGDLTYNFIINILQIEDKNITTLIDSIWDIPFTLFLGMIFVFYCVKFKKANDKNLESTLFLFFTAIRDMSKIKFRQSG